MSVILLKLAPYLIAGAALLGVGGWIGWSINPWQGRYTSLQAADAIERAHGEEAVRQALSAQLAQAQEVTRNNQNAMVVLANENAQTAADRDATVARVHRLEQLLNAESAARAAQSRSVPQAGDRPPTAGAPGDPSVGQAGELLIAARDECRRNAARYQALIAEITPQL
jgi:hypothetical protein